MHRHLLPWCVGTEVTDAQCDADGRADAETRGDEMRDVINKRYCDVTVTLQPEET